MYLPPAWVKCQKDICSDPLDDNEANFVSDNDSSNHWPDNSGMRLSAIVTIGFKLLSMTLLIWSTVPLKQIFPTLLQVPHDFTKSVLLIPAVTFTDSSSMHSYFIKSKGKVLYNYPSSKHACLRMSENQKSRKLWADYDKDF